MKRIKILIVDDEESFSQILKIATDTWYSDSTEVRIVLSFDGARREIEEFKPDLILLDLSLDTGDMGGIEILRIVSDSYPETEVIIISGKGERDEAIESLNLGAHGYIIKPFNSILLHHMLDQVLEKIHVKWASEENQKKIESKLNLLLESINNGVLFHNSDGVIQDVNSVFCRQMRLKKEAIIGKMPYELFDRIEDTDKLKISNFLINRTLGEKMIFRGSLNTPDKSGRILLEICMQMVEIGTEKSIFSISRDISLTTKDISVMLESVPELIAKGKNGSLEEARKVLEELEKKLIDVARELKQAV